MSFVARGEASRCIGIYITVLVMHVWLISCLGPVKRGQRDERRGCRVCVERV